MSEEQQGNAPHRWRGIIRNVDPDTVYRSVRAVNGFRSWEDPPRTLYQLATTTLEVVRDTDGWFLFVNGASRDRVLNSVTRIGFRQEDVTLETVPSSDCGIPHAVRQARLRNAGAA